MRYVMPPLTVDVAELQPTPRSSRVIKRELLRPHPLNDEKFRADLRGILTGSYLLHDGRYVRGEAVSRAQKTMRGYHGCSDLKSGRCWRGLGPLGVFEDRCEQLGFKIERGHGRRVYRNGYRYGAKARVVFEELGEPRANTET